MATTPSACKQITEAAERKGVHVIVCHVLRFASFWITLKGIIDSGAIGEIVSISHMENVGNQRQAHSYVRGNWRNAAESSPMILAKCCHDTDLIQWLIGKPCKKVQSFGSLTHFSKANTIANPSDEAVMEALRTGPYGRCVYDCDNDEVDHQIVNMEFEGSVIASLSMNAFNEGGRFIRVFGTAGEITMGEEDWFNVYSFADRQTHQVPISTVGNAISNAHGGGDVGIMIDTVNFFGKGVASPSICDVRMSYLGHLIAFAAEESRLNGVVVDLDEYSTRW